MAKDNLYFHQTFNLELTFLSKTISLTTLDGLSKEEISEITGIATGKFSGKVEPAIVYSKYCNLIDYTKKNGKYNIELRKLAKIILKEDKYISEDITKRLLGYFLTSKYFGAPMWFKVLRRYLQLSNSKEAITRHLIEEYGCSNRIAETSLKCIFSGDLTKENINEDLSLKNQLVKKEEIYAYAFTMISDLEKMVESESEFEGFRTLREFTEKNLEDIKWKEGYYFSKNQEIEVINLLEQKGIIRVNKQLSPQTFSFNYTSDEILKKIFSLLL